MKSKLQSRLASACAQFNHLRSNTMLRAGLAGASLLATAGSAHAGTFSLPSLTSFVCTLLEWMTGELALGVFLIVVVITFVIGFFAKMDWTKILAVIVLYGILQGLANLFSGFLNGSLGCLGF